MDIATTIGVAQDLAALKDKQRAAWGSGDYSIIGTTLQIVGENLAEACDLNWDQHVLDVAAGNGNATLAAARRGSRVISTDYVDSLLKAGARRAEAENLDAQFEIADAEALPFDSGTFDAVISTFGVMFAPNHKKSAAELVRVCRPGGKIGLANWTPDSLVGEIFKAIGKQLPPPAGAQSPALWGSELHLRDLFGGHIGQLSITKRHFNFRFRSAQHFVDVFRAWYGPMHKAFLALPHDKAKQLEQDLLDIINRANRDRAGKLVAVSEYLEVVITRK